MIPDTKIDGKRLREVAGAFATGVTVITTQKADGGIHGITANSFLSVSLDPPLVSFCLQNDSSLLPLMKKDKIVGISILEASQKDVSNQFAGLNKKDIEVATSLTASGATVIDGALAWYSTRVQQIIPAGDHYLVLCAVKELDRVSVKEGKPLLYFSGYRTTGELV